MKQIRVSSLVPGMILEKELSSSGVNILNQGTILTEHLIEKLKNWDPSGTLELTIQDLSPLLTEQHEAILTTQITIALDQVVKKLETIIAILEPQKINRTLLDETLYELEEQIGINSNILLRLTHLKTENNYLFTHLTNVCIISLLIGKELQLKPEQLKELGITALLHDFGMTKINQTIYNQERKLTDEEWLKIKHHPVYGYDFFNKSKIFTEEVLKGIRDHHERADGSGYPQGLTNSEINLYSKIISIADVYDACTSERKHRKGISPYNVVKNMLAQSHLYEIEILKAFLSCISVYPVGSLIRLNSGEIAKVIGVNHGMPFRPEIHILVENNNQKLDQPKRANLANEEYAGKYVKESVSFEEWERIFNQKTPSKMTG